MAKSAVLPKKGAVFSLNGTATIADRMNAGKSRRKKVSGKQNEVRQRSYGFCAPLRRLN
jgi:hypothetical protein